MSSIRSGGCGGRSPRSSTSAALVVRVFIKTRPPAQTSDREIILLAEKGAKEGTLSTSESNIIANALSLDDVRVSEIMTPRTVVTTLRKTATVGEVFREYPEHPVRPHSRLPEESRRHRRPRAPPRPAQGQGQRPGSRDRGQPHAGDQLHPRDGDRGQRAAGFPQDPPATARRRGRVRLDRRGRDHGGRDGAHPRPRDLREGRRGGRHARTRPRQVAETEPRPPPRRPGAASWPPGKEADAPSRSCLQNLGSEIDSTAARLLGPQSQPVRHPLLGTTSASAGMGWPTCSAFWRAAG